MLLQQGLAAQNLARGDAAPQIIGKGLQKLGLAAVEFDHALDRRDAAERGIEAPIISAVAAILDGKITIGQAVTALMTRPLKTETDI